jgi:Mn-dependent DtxR family transcriptional regulator
MVMKIGMGQGKKAGEKLNSFELEALRILTGLGGKAGVQTIAREMKRNFDYVHRICCPLEKGGYIDLNASSGIAQITSKGKEENKKPISLP